MPIVKVEQEVVIGFIKVELKIPSECDDFGFDLRVGANQNLDLVELIFGRGIL